MKSFGSSDWKLLSQDLCYEGFFKLVRYHFQHKKFNGEQSSVLSREIFVRGDATCVLLYDPFKDAVVLVEQFRVGGLLHDKAPWMLELVAGINESGEEPRDVAKRESIEEADASILDLLHIQDFYPSPGGSTERIHLFAGLVDSSGLGGVHGLEHEGEDIKTHVIPLDRARTMLDEGVIDNSPAIIALQWLLLNKESVDARWRQLGT